MKPGCGTTVLLFCFGRLNIFWHFLKLQWHPFLPTLASADQDPASRIRARPECRCTFTLLPPGNSMGSASPGRHHSSHRVLGFSGAPRALKEETPAVSGSVPAYRWGPSPTTHPASGWHNEELSGRPIRAKNFPAPPFLLFLLWEAIPSMNK